MTNGPSSEEGYPKWALDNTSTVPYDPANEISRAGGKKILHDGNTEVAVTPGFADGGEIQGPCLNPSCRSYGKPHPNCLCYAGPGGTSLEGMSKGGFCSQNRSHHPQCQFYAEGGAVQDNSQIQDSPEDTIGHAAIEHGLLGLLQDVGQRKLTDPEKHISRMQESFSNPNKEEASKDLTGHPLVGSISSSKLQPIMDRISFPVASMGPHPEAHRNAVDYLHSAMKGHSSLESHIGKLFSSDKLPSKNEVPKESRDSLKKYLDETKEDPQQILEIGGTLGHYLPEHSVGLGAHAAVALNYLHSLKPTQTQSGPLDDPSPVDKSAEAKYNRALDLVQHPLMVLHYAKEGYLLPQDVQTLNTVYPGLHKSMVKKIGHGLIEARAKKIEIPYRQRLALSMLIGQPLDSTMSVSSRQAIIKANAGAQAPQSQPNQQKRASGVELKQINKVNALDQTPLQRRQSERKS